MVRGVAGVSTSIMVVPAIEHECELSGVGVADADVDPTKSPARAWSVVAYRRIVAGGSAV